MGGEGGEGGGCTLVDLTAPFIKQRTTLWRSEQYRRGPVLRGGGNSAQQANITIGLVVEGNCRDPKKKEMGEGNEIDATIEKATFDSWTLRTKKDLLSSPNLFVLQIKKLN